MTGVPAAPDPAPPGEGRDAAARLIVEEAAARYCAARRARIDGFVDRNFSLLGALRLHRRALGWDLLRSPANLALAAPHLAARVSAGLVRRAGLAPAAAWLDSRRYFLQTDVARELEWRIYTELLELPFRQGKRILERDALADEILRDARNAAGGADDLRSPAEQEALRNWLTGAAGTYEGTRVAAADLTTAALTIGLTGGLLAAGAVVGAFSGVVTDPIQRRLGLHHRRLRRLIDCLERELTGQGDSRFVVRDHYVARTLDVIEALGLVWRAAR